uniref:C2H2-type domain-containing protein n=1 Tax=Odontella aurita TaxID=265563 RepID=A0A7S4JYJ5_9STRA
MADITPHFKFYVYGVDGRDIKGKLIDSRNRRFDLFKQGLLAKETGLLARLGMSPKEVENLKRVIFFEGSTFYSARKIQGLERANLPRALVGTKESKKDETPMGDSGDSLTITEVKCYVAPRGLKTTSANVPSAAGVTKSSDPSEARYSVDRRCDDCTKAFTDLEALLQHCSIENHSPVTAPDEEDRVEEPTYETFLAYCNIALQQAMNERMARWGREYIDPTKFKDPKDRNGNDLGVRVFQAYTCEFGMNRPDFKSPLSLTLTVDLRAKLLRNKTVLDQISEGKNPNSARYDQRRVQDFKRRWKGEVVICTYDKKCYSVIDLLFDKSAASMPVPNLAMSHAEYFQKRKNIKLKYPDARPLVAVLGRKDSTIYLPAELVCGNELEPRLKQQLPQIASFMPPERHNAIEEMKRYLQPNAQKTKGKGGGLLPALGIVLKEERFKVPVEVLPLPQIVVSGMRVPERSGTMWAPMLARADYQVNPNRAVKLNVVLVHHENLKNTCKVVYDRIRDLVNGFNSTYRFPNQPCTVVVAGDNERHWGAVERYFGSGSQIPSNVFVIDLCRPLRRAALDAAYPVIKQLLGKSGYLSQFVNFNTYDHGNPRDMRKSNTILQGVARQVLSKCGVRIWWVNIPRSLPLPAVFVGVDVYHAPRKYSEKEGTRVAKASVAAIVVEVMRKPPGESPSVEIYSETFKRERAGQEMELGSAMHQCVSNALRILNVREPRSCFVWRDGVGDAGIQQVAGQEIPQVKAALASAGGPVGGQAAAVAKANQCPISYIVCQKRISTKFLSADGQHAMPTGTLVTGLQGPNYATFYINGTSPPCE